MKKEPTPEVLLAVIRAHCLDCCGGSRLEVRNCDIQYCKLWPYRRAEKKKKSSEESLKGQMTIFDLMEKRANA